MTGILWPEKYGGNNSDYVSYMIVIEELARVCASTAVMLSKDVIRVCGAYGFDVVIVETVGVGQSELDIMKIVDSTAVVLTPHSGDILQVFKAGIMEIADIFVINKADLQGATKLDRLLKELVQLTNAENRSTSIIKTVTTENEQIDQLWDQLNQHYQHRYHTSEGENELMKQRIWEVCDIIQDEIRRDVMLEEHRERFHIKQDEPPYQIALEWYEKWKKDVTNK